MILNSELLRKNYPPNLFNKGIF